MEAEDSPELPVAGAAAALRLALHWCGCSSAAPMPPDGPADQRMGEKQNITLPGQEVAEGAICIESASAPVYKTSVNRALGEGPIPLLLPAKVE